MQFITVQCEFARKNAYFEVVRPCSTYEEVEGEGEGKNDVGMNFRSLANWKNINYYKMHENRIKQI